MQNIGKQSELSLCQVYLFNIAFLFQQWFVYFQAKVRKSKLAFTEFAPGKIRVANAEVGPVVAAEPPKLRRHRQPRVRVEVAEGRVAMIRCTSRRPSSRRRRQQNTMPQSRPSRRRRPANRRTRRWAPSRNAESVVPFRSSRRLLSKTWVDKIFIYR